MDSKLAIFTILLIGMISDVSAENLTDANLESLAIAFLVLCVIILLVALLVPICILHRSRNKDETRMRSSSKYNMSSKRDSQLVSGNYNENVGVYGYYTDPQPTGSIYLPLSEKRNDEENGYAHLSTTTTEENKEGTHTYETLKNSNTFKTNENENAYDNPGSIIDDRQTNDDDDDDDDGSEHDYEMADVSVDMKGPAYENPVEVNDKEETAF